MDTVNQMRIFVRIAEAGTFTAAARTLNTSPGAISRAIAELESRLRTRLLHRTTRKVALTSAGQLYLQRCAQILSDIEKAEEEASQAQQRPAGQLRVHSFTGCGMYYVLPAIKEYRLKYPDVAVDLTLSQDVPQLYDGHIDVAVITTSSPLPDSDLISHLLGSTVSILCASPAYINKIGAPSTPDDLVDHDCLILRANAFPANDWLLESLDRSAVMKVSGSVTLNTAESTALAVKASMGIGVLPVYAALDGLADGSLVRILPEYTLQKMNLYALHPSRQYTDAKIRTWVTFLREYVATSTARDLLLLSSYA
ncbi:LysR family transcriptional regulator [Paraburkholderia sp. MM5384-R2]|uniref:LysR family transcriptional regulator n=1 Tax=Paraburkholderia sp. MM5384-R2 TaxID=2723097 RepID=UPI00161EDD2E|nr:LysR family transcriptional regulator [Paraburkholderia sp. MM5384-R2]MBB5499323.1 DNA-binding transcriptional LysR family regulator [Paraburkholderia sp. MM5384-R2]